MMKAREGFSLVETMVAMTMFAVVMLGMAQMAAAVAVKGRTNDVVAKRNAVLQLEANKFGAAPFTSLATWSTADKVFTRGPFTYTRRLTITATSSTRYTVKVVIIPAVDATKKDSVIIERSLPPTGSPLCSGC
jgi:prepilin-type N-terminal cleavage/methylation domain-containing protein